ncbi:MAG: M23 family metallopeptidase [Patescibacteria group bacterium]
MFKTLIAIVILGGIAVYALSFDMPKKEVVPEPKEVVVVPEIPAPVVVPAPTVEILPTHIIQGDPVMVSFSEVPEEVVYKSKKVPTFVYKGQSRVLIPVDFTEKPGTYHLLLTWESGATSSEAIRVNERPKIEAPLGIPEKLGGNTPAGEKNVISNLAKENAELAQVQTENKILWDEAFRFPLESVTVTDDYGYNRATGQSTIVHKGTDLRAPKGTQVFAMNDGIVRISRLYTIYGNTIVVDHGLGVHTFYMHLSRRDLKEGDSIKKGQPIGLSGDTGYAESPHLHMTIRLNGVSIDPMRFMEFFKE